MDLNREKHDAVRKLEEVLESAGEAALVRPPRTPPHTRRDHRPIANGPDERDQASSCPRAVSAVQRAADEIFEHRQCKADPRAARGLRASTAPKRPYARS